ncbi:MAG: LacI family DNA-binding transcriptional regulator [Acidobacteria bacterium]|nr:LacI family DNA-binding transcriptional regulator [Acidobacteriota bacterium]
MTLQKQSGKAKASPDVSNAKASIHAKPVSLKVLAEYLGLSPATISLVLNNAAGVEAISEPTRRRVLQAAKDFGYRPSYLGRVLRSRRTFSIGVLVPQLNDGYCAEILEGIEEVLMEEGYVSLIVSHRRRRDLIEEYPRLLQDRSVEGFILIDTPIVYPEPWTVPVVAVSGHQNAKNLTNIVLDQKRAAMLALDHLQKLGHSQIAFMRGASYSADADRRWLSFREAAKTLGLKFDPALTIDIPLHVSSPEVGYGPMRDLLLTKKRFTAIVAFNDHAAIGAIRALHEFGVKVPEDVSVIGFDDIKSAAYHRPSLTTIRQPLREIGKTAVTTLLGRITNQAPAKQEILMYPELVIRESTGIPPQISKQKRK